MTETWNWINQNSGGVQAVGSVIAILIAVAIAWLSHWFDVRRSKDAQRREDARVLETVASIVINAMNLIQIAKEQLCDNRGTLTESYFNKVYDARAFRTAGEALREVPIAQLPNFEVVKPVLGMRHLILEADKMVAQIQMDYVSSKGNWQAGIDRFSKLHYSANKHTSTVESVVRRVRDGD